ncbi:MAG: hypothetical protein ACR2LN_07730 [Candidatus Levyibacteriota bacterium]
MTALPILLPEGFSPLISVGDTLKPGKVIAQRLAPQDQSVNIMEGLRLSRSQARKALTKSPGDRINPGDRVAVKKGLFGKIKGSITSSISGVILRYERDTGNLVVRTDYEAASLELISPVAGTVTLCNNKEIVIQTEHALVSEGVALGTSGEGQLFILEESFEDTSADNTLYYLDRRAVGKIVLLHTVTREVLTKGNSIGVAGFIGIVIGPEEIVFMGQKKFQLPVLEINEDLAEELDAWRDKKVMIDVTSKSIILRDI